MTDPVTPSPAQAFTAQEYRDAAKSLKETFDNPANDWRALFDCVLKAVDALTHAAGMLSDAARLREAHERLEKELDKAHRLAHSLMIADAENTARLEQQIATLQQEIEDHIRNYAVLVRKRERDIETLTRERDEARAERDALQADVRAVADGFLFAMPAPGTDCARLMVENRVTQGKNATLTQQLDEAHAELGDCRQQCFEVSSAHIAAERQLAERTEERDNLRASKYTMDDHHQLRVQLANFEARLVERDAQLDEAQKALAKERWSTEQIETLAAQLCERDVRLDEAQRARDAWITAAEKERERAEAAERQIAACLSYVDEFRKTDIVAKIVYEMLSKSPTVEVK